jgi:hypothetical protein
VRGNHRWRAGLEFLGDIVSNIVTVSDVERMAVAVSKSGLFGVKNVEQAMALMLIAQAEGMHPAIAARDFHVIQGRPALKADAMLARFQAAGGKVQWTCYTAEKVSGIFSHPAGGSIEVDWTIQQAKTAGLTGKDVWKQYPRAMLRARVISEGIRTVYPGVAVGVYTPEEIADADSSAGRIERDMGAADVVPPPPADMPPGLLESANAAAAQGKAAFKAFWDLTSQDDRVALRPYRISLRDACHAADGHEDSEA